MKYFIPQFDPNRPTILCVASEQFMRDIAVLQQMSQRFNWMAFREKEWVKQQRHWMPGRLQHQGLYNNERGPDVDAAWQRAKDLALDMLRKVQNNTRLAAVMAGNWDYWTDEGLRLACDELGIPFLVLMREHNLTEAKPEREHYENSKLVPKTAGVAVASDLTANFLSGIGVLPRSKLRSTGLPRFDAWRMPFESLYDRPVVLLSYRKGYDAEDHFDEMLQIFARIADKYPDVPFVVKAKHPREAGVIQQDLDARGIRLKAIDTPYIPALFQNARAIVGFNSLAVYEALFTDAHIMLPQWGTTKISPSLQAPCPTDPVVTKHMDFFDSPEAFEAALDRTIRVGPPAVDRRARLEAFAEYVLYKDDETATERVEQFAADYTS